MKIHWSDLDLISEGLELDDTCRLDPATGRFTMEEVGYPFLAGVWPRPDERHLWGASMDRPERGTVVRARYLMRRLRARRACASGLADPAQREHMLRVLDGEGSPEQRAAFATTSRRCLLARAAARRPSSSSASSRSATIATTRSCGGTRTGSTTTR
ncbi:hypothetical protein OV079_03180 [Nannocystis pusilla]|uniref:Uncharacterized protein n=1 Tax=Nannocystis pusilla TaxID=889268 RepID=A0A9X3IWA4_9BACT|nr:hypothetical protein [Nannocystis pusilla]MCY1004588.1 hypothetical protein [Nannocystis pusilla]